MISSDFDMSEYLTPAQLVKRWKDAPFPASLVTLARWRRDDCGPAYVKVGHKSNRVLYAIKDVEAYEQTLIPHS